MADPEFLAPAQVAAEVHVTVVTVRRWINTGALHATKAGPRKWMVRRSDLDAFLTGGSADGPGGAVVDVSEDPSFRRYLARVSVERAKEQLELSEGRWASAIREHAQPPPDAGFARRLRALADAAAQEQAAYGTRPIRGSGGGRGRRGCRRMSCARHRGATHWRPLMLGSGSMTRSRGCRAPEPA